MPIRYSFGGLHEFMSFELKNAYIAAVKDIYRVEADRGQGQEYLKGTVRHGVFTSNGLPLTIAGMNPNDDNRILMQVDTSGLPGKDTKAHYLLSEGLKGKCMDSEGNRYTYAQLFNRKKDGFTYGDCVRFCDMLDNESEQVGFTCVAL